MRFYFLILLSIFLISAATVITVNNITGNIPVIEGCPEKCTYLPFNTPEGLERIKGRIIENFYIQGIYQAPGFDNENEQVACVCQKE